MFSNPTCRHRATVGVVAWMRANLFSSWLNTLLTLFAFYLIWLIVPPMPVGDDRRQLGRHHPRRLHQSGACWVFISSASASSCTATTRPNCAGAWT
jgi:hypothetical protein